MFEVGWTEMLLIGVVILLAFGPKELPKIARNLGRTLNELKSALKHLIDD